MKKVLVALVCTLGAVACGESRPAESPTTTTSVTTETTTTKTPSSNGMISTTPASTPSTTTTAPADGLDTTQPLRDSNSSMTGNTGAAPVTTGTTGNNAPSTNNPGVADGTKDATNTKINDRDRHGTVTPMNQGGGADRDITAAIRRAVVADKGLSFTAKNVKIITVNGKVTLRGPVKSEEEKSSIESKAKAATGVSEVDDQLEVKK